MNIHASLKYIIEGINRKKKVILIKYSSTLYSVISVLEKEFNIIKFSFIFKSWILVAPNLSLPRKLLRLKIFSSRSRENFLCYKRLKAYVKRNMYVILSSTSGTMCSAHTAIQQKKGGFLYCILY